MERNGGNWLLRWTHLRNVNSFKIDLRLHSAGAVPSWDGWEQGQWVHAQNRRQHPGRLARHKRQLWKRREFFHLRPIAESGDIFRCHSHQVRCVFGKRAQQISRAVGDGKVFHPWLWPWRLIFVVVFRNQLKSVAFDVKNVRVLCINFGADINVECVGVEAAKKELLRAIRLFALTKLDELVFGSHLVVRFALVFSEAVAVLDVDLQGD